MSKITPNKGGAFLKSRWRIEEEPELVKNFTVRSTHQLYTGEGKGDGFFTLGQTYSQMATKQLSKEAVAHLENRKGKVIKA
jgi:hypothetical protein